MTNKTEVAVIQSQLSPLIQKSKELSIDGKLELDFAVELLSELNRWSDNVKSDKERMTIPLNEALKEIRSKYKPVEEMLEQSIGSVRLKMSQYQAKVIQARKDAEDKLLARVGEGKGSIKLETAIKKLDETEAVNKTVGSDSGSVTFIEVEKFEVLDVTLLPPQYILANEPEIRQAMKRGERLPGVRYYKEQSVRNKR